MVWGCTFLCFLSYFICTSCLQECLGERCVSATEGGGSWSPLFSRPFNDWEVDEVYRFLLGLNGKCSAGCGR